MGRRAGLERLHADHPAVLAYLSTHVGEIVQVRQNKAQPPEARRAALAAQRAAEFEDRLEELGSAGRGA